MINWKYDLLLATVLFIIAVAFYTTGSTYPETPFLFPSYLAPMLGLLALWLGVSAVRRRGEENGEVTNWSRFKGPAFVIALGAAYIGIVEMLGFVASSFLLLAVFYLGMGFKNKIGGIILAFIIAALIYALFHIALEVSLPIGSIWEAY